MCNTGSFATFPGSATGKVQSCHDLEGYCEPMSEGEVGNFSLVGKHVTRRGSKISLWHWFWEGFLRGIITESFLTLHARGKLLVCRLVPNCSSWNGSLRRGIQVDSSSIVHLLVLVFYKVFAGCLKHTQLVSRLLAVDSWHAAAAAIRVIYDAGPIIISAAAAESSSRGASTV